MKETIQSFQITSLERLPIAQPCSSVSWERNGYYAAQDFCVSEFTKTESATAERRAFRLRQPVERAENLEYRNQLSGVCWGSVYSSVESIFLNHAVYIYIYIYIYIYRSLNAIVAQFKNYAFEKWVKERVLTNLSWSKPFWKVLRLLNLNLICCSASLVHIWFFFLVLNKTKLRFWSNLTALFGLCHYWSKN